MAEEAPRYSEPSNLSGKPEFSAHITPSAAETRIGRFFQKINQFFKAAPEHPDVKLSGHIYELHLDADKILSKLSAIKVELDRETDTLYVSLVLNVIDPLIKDVTRILKTKEHTGSVAQQIRTFRSDTDCLEKAKHWLNLCLNRCQDKESIYKALIDHVLQEFHARIDRDLQVIQDYLNQTIDSIELNDLVKNELKERLEPELSQHLFELYLLKDHPKDLTIDSFNGWRSTADLARESYFSAALHTIDQYIKEVEPRPAGEEMSDYNTKILMQLIAMEERISKLSRDISNYEESGDENIKHYAIAQLEKLEEEAHHINCDLRLIHEHIERVQQILSILSAFREHLS